MDAKPPSRPPHMLFPEIPPYQVTVNPRQQTSHTANLTQELSGLAHAQASLHTAASRPTRSSPRGLCSLGRKRRGFRLLLHRPELGPKGRCRWEPLSHGPLPELARTAASALTRARGTAWPIKVAQEDQRLVALLASRQRVREWLEALPKGWLPPSSPSSSVFRAQTDITFAVSGQTCRKRTYCPLLPSHPFCLRDVGR